LRSDGRLWTLCGLTTLCAVALTGVGRLDSGDASRPFWFPDV